MVEAMVAGKYTIVHKCDGLLREANFIYGMYNDVSWINICLVIATVVDLSTVCAFDTLH